MPPVCSQAHYIAKVLFSQPVIIVNDNFKGTGALCICCFITAFRFILTHLNNYSELQVCFSINISLMTWIQVLKCWFLPTPEIISRFIFYINVSLHNSTLNCLCFMCGAGEFSSNGFISFLWGKMPPWPNRFGWVVICFVHFTEIGPITW